MERAVIYFESEKKAKAAARRWAANCPATCAITGAYTQTAEGWTVTAHVSLKSVEDHGEVIKSFNDTFGTTHVVVTDMEPYEKIPGSEPIAPPAPKKTPEEIEAEKAAKAAAKEAEKAEREKARAAEKADREADRAAKKAEQEAAKAAAKAAKAAAAPTEKPKGYQPPAKDPRPGTKTYEVWQLMLRPQGCTMGEARAITKWSEDVTSTLFWELAKRVGRDLVREGEKGDARVYKFAA
jgi:hypothetical protein